MIPLELTTPLSDSDVEQLRAGNVVTLSGVIYTARDAAHKRMVDAIRDGKGTPLNLSGQVIYFAGPTPSKPGWPIGSVGPTTASRMDPYAPVLIERGLKGMIGKGSRSASVVKAMQTYKCVYFGAVEGTAALLAQCVQRAEVVAYEDLGTEAIHLLVVRDFPVIVLNDIYGGDLYQVGRQQYSVKRQPRYSSAPSK